MENEETNTEKKTRTRRPLPERLASMGPGAFAEALKKHEDAKAQSLAAFSSDDAAFHAEQVKRAKLYGAGA